MKLYIASPEMGENNGVGQVLKYHKKYLRKLGVKIVQDAITADVTIDHLGCMPGAGIHYSHGLWFGKVDNGKAQQNAQIIETIRNARAVIVPSEYVAETFRRDFRINPYIVGHAVEYNEWQADVEKGGYVLWNKNRASAVCNPEYMQEMAKRFPNQLFVSTFGNPQPNVKITGALPFLEMKDYILKANVYLATSKETFCIGALEAMASGSPVLGFGRGGIADIASHKEDGYLATDFDDLCNGLLYIREHYSKMSGLAKKKAMSYNWEVVAMQLLKIFEAVLKENR